MDKTEVSRQYIRHPSGMPIQFDIEGDLAPMREQLRNVSKGGLCFCAKIELIQGFSIHIRIPVVNHSFEADCVVTWCRVSSCGYDVGVSFNQVDDVFGMRMVEQLCYIEEYRTALEKDQGRVLTSEEAASEWIDQFAAEFPQMS